MSVFSFMAVRLYKKVIFPSILCKYSPRIFYTILTFIFYILSLSFPIISLCMWFQGANLTFLSSRWMIKYSSTIFKVNFDFLSGLKCHHCHFFQYILIYILGFSTLVHQPFNLFLFKCHGVLITGILFKPYDWLMQVFYSLFAFFQKYLNCYQTSIFSILCISHGNFHGDLCCIQVL